jgi:hypothetical protein
MPRKITGTGKINGGDINIVWYLVAGVAPTVKGALQ